MWLLKPAIDRIQRKNAGRVSAGDRIDASLAQADWGLCKTLAGSSFDLAGSGPLLPAIAASFDLVTLPGEPDAMHWAPQQLTVEWVEGHAVDGTVRASVTAALVRRDTVRIAIDGNCRGRPLYRGEFIFAPEPQKPLAIRDAAAELLFRVIRVPSIIALGTSGNLSLEFYSTARIELTLPYGYGLRAPGGIQFDVEPGVHQIEIVADRPDAVNLRKPWPLRISARSGSRSQEAKFDIRVPDPRPGQTYYILTEDCETFDGGPLTGNYGAAASLGNHNNFMDPEDYLIQMVAKPAKMNEIAEKHGACWTHFWAAHQRFGAAWAAGQSRTGRWTEVIELLDESIRTGSAKHEYAPHLHCDYEPDCTLPPQPRLHYDAQTDGILPTGYFDPVLNPAHRFHDWDGAKRGGPGIKPLGQWDDLQSKTGSLFKALHHVSALEAQNRAALCCRTGSFDFGGTPDDQEISTTAYETLGLCGNSDARITDGVPAGGHLYFCKANDRFTPIETLEDARLVQLAVTCEVEFTTAEEVNEWFAKHEATCRLPGVHGLVLTTHAMFMRGEGDPFRSLEGGSFANLDRHLAWVRNNYPDVQFATASEVLLKFLDYYTPMPVGVVDPRLIGGEPEQALFVFGVHILGEGIFVSRGQPARVDLVAPACFKPSQVRCMEARMGTEVIGRAEGNRISISLDSPGARVTLAIRVREEAVTEAAQLFTRDCGQPFHDFPERERPALLQIDPGSGQHFHQALSLLTNPIAGNGVDVADRRPYVPMLLIGAALQEADRLGEGFVVAAAEVTFAPGVENAAIPGTQLTISAQLVDRPDGRTIQALAQDGEIRIATVTLRLAPPPSPTLRARFMNWRTRASRLLGLQ